MRTERKSVVAVLPDGSEYCDDSADPRFYMAVASAAVSNAGLTTPRDAPKDVKVKVFELNIRGGKIERKLANTFDVPIPLERMTDLQFRDAMQDLLGNVPPEFHGFIEKKAWDDGHAQGYEEVVLHADNLIDELMPAIKAYRKSLKQGM
jgi:hypothetical protein